MRKQTTNKELIDKTFAQMEDEIGLNGETIRCHYNLAVESFKAELARRGITAADLLEN